MAVSRAKGVLVDKLAEHDDLFFAGLGDEVFEAQLRDDHRPVLARDADMSDWYFDRLDREAELF